MHQRYFYSLRCIILRLQKEVIGSGLENTFQNHKKNIQDMMKTISFSILFSTLQLFFNPLFFPFLQRFTAGENLRVAGDSTGHRRILTTLNKNVKTLVFSFKEIFHDIIWAQISF